MSMTPQFQPGDFALTRIGGIAGRGIAVGQWAIGDGAPVQHAMLYVGAGMVVQAMPGGAEMIHLDRASEPVIWSGSAILLTPMERAHICRWALRCVGTPYSFVDYASIGLAHLRIRPRWVRDYVASTGHMICSQLVDAAYEAAGVHLFNDGRLPGDVTPGDLYGLLRSNGPSVLDGVRPSA